LHQRKTNSLTRTWALTIAAFIFYIPANVLPITVVTSLGKTQADTIMSGVIYFVQTGMWPIALVIFVASVAVPLLKLFALAFLLISVQRKWAGCYLFCGGGGDHHVCRHELRPQAHLGCNGVEVWLSKTRVSQDSRMHPRLLSR
jgi:hypothetical protein